MTKNLILYTKFCAKCMWPSKFAELQSYASNKGYSVKVIRTAYRPAWHKEASKLYGSEDYMAFFVEKGKVVDLLQWTSKTKKKPVMPGKVKGGNKNDVSRLPKTKGDDRVGSLGDKEIKA